MRKFYKFAYQPSSAKIEITNLTIKLTDLSDADKYIEIYVNKGKGQTLNFMAAADNQLKYGSYVSGSGFYDYQEFGVNGMAYKSQITSVTASKIGLNEVDYAVNAYGSSEAPISFVYDKDDNALYSSVTDGTNDKLKSSYAVRNFSGNYTDTDRGGVTDVKWKGFSSSFVNVTLTFSKLTVDKSSVIITKIGKYDLSGSEVFVDDNDYFKSSSNKTPTEAIVDEGVKIYSPVQYTAINQKPILNSKAIIQGNGVNETLTFTEEYVNYVFNATGAYVITFYDDDGVTQTHKTSINVGSARLTNQTLGVKPIGENAAAELGAYAQIGSNVKFTGLKLSGKTGATFNLGKFDLSSSNWKGSYDQLTAFSNSFLEFAFNPSTNKNELKEVIFTLSQGGKKVSISVRYCSFDSIENEIAIVAKADNQSNYGCYRKGRSQLILANAGTVRKGLLKGKDGLTQLGLQKNYKTGAEGNAETAIALFYDNDALYSSSTTVVTSVDDLANSYLIRNFKSENLNDNNGEIWQGFTADGSGKIKVNLTVTFGETLNNDETSVVVTKIGDTDFKKGTLIIDNSDFTTEVTPVKTAVTVGENVKVYAPTKYHPLYKKFISGSYAEVYYNDNYVDKITFTSGEYNYSFNNVGKYVVKYYASDGTFITSVDVTAT